MNDPYVLTYGTVQPYVYRFGDGTRPLFMHFFGRAEYDSKKPVLTERKRKEAQPIVDALNAGTMSEDEAKKQLDKLYW